MKASEILTRAAGHIDDRATRYDKQAVGGERSIAAVVEAFRALTGDGLMNTPERGWMFMALLKIARSQQGEFHPDNYEDGAAYMALMGEAAAVDFAKPVPAVDPIPGSTSWLESKPHHKPEPVVEWGGGECPLDPSVDVRVMMRGEHGKWREPAPAAHYIWRHEYGSEDIMAYQVVRQ